MSLPRYSVPQIASRIVAVLVREGFSWCPSPSRRDTYSYFGGAELAVDIIYGVTALQNSRTLAGASLIHWQSLDELQLQLDKLGHVEGACLIVPAALHVCRLSVVAFTVTIHRLP